MNGKWKRRRRSNRIWMKRKVRKGNRKRWGAGKKRRIRRYGENNEVNGGYTQ